MGKTLYDSFTEARTIYDTADAILGRRLSDLCFNGPADALQRTDNAQPALLVTSLAHLAVLRATYPGSFDGAHFVAGHSLGEYTALVASGVLALDDALRLVAERGMLMHEAGSSGGTTTGMSALLGLPDVALNELCKEADVDLANLNAPGQVVISGSIDALERAGALARDLGAKRVIPLPVSAAFHSRWMRPMAEQFERSVLRTVFHAPRIPVVANVTATAASQHEIPHLLVRQTYSSVRWIESIRYMAERGVQAFVEIGPGKVLSGLVKRITPDAQLFASDDLLAEANS